MTGRGNLPSNSTLSESLFWSGIVNTCIRLNGLVEMITHSALVNHGGGLRKERGVVYAQPSWWATHLYGTMRGTIPLAVRVRAPLYSVTEEAMPTVKDAPYVDAVALTNGDRSAVTLMVVNTHPHQEMATTISLTHWPVPKALVGRQLGAPSFMTRNSWDAPDRVVIRQIHEPVATAGGQLQHVLPPHSITEFVFFK